MVERHGHEEIRDINARLILVWHREWSDGGKIAMAHAFVGHLRTLFGFGMTILEDPECERLCNVLHKMRFQAPKPRTERLDSRAGRSRPQGRPGAFRLGVDRVGPGSPIRPHAAPKGRDRGMGARSEPGLSDVSEVHKGTDKWVRGLRWSEINENLILKHNTSKREKDLTVDLKLAPMVLKNWSSGSSPGTPPAP
jgi:hypothetical protein